MGNCWTQRPFPQKSPLPVPCALFENPLMVASWWHRRALVFIRPTQLGHSLRRYLWSAHWAPGDVASAGGSEQSPCCHGVHPWAREMDTQLKR